MCNNDNADGPATDHKTQLQSHDASYFEGVDFEEEDEVGQAKVDDQMEAEEEPFDLLPVDTRRRKTMAKYMDDRGNKEKIDPAL